MQEVDQEVNQEVNQEVRTAASILVSISSNIFDKCCTYREKELACRDAILSTTTTFPYQVVLRDTLLPNESCQALVFIKFNRFVDKVLVGKTIVYRCDGQGTMTSNYWVGKRVCCSCHLLARNFLYFQATVMAKVKLLRMPPKFVLTFLTFHLSAVDRNGFIPEIFIEQVVNYFYRQHLRSEA